MQSKVKAKPCSWTRGTWVENEKKEEEQRWDEMEKIKSKK